MNIFNELRRKFDRSSASTLGLEYRPGDPHYRAYVGPPMDYDLVAAMVFNLLTSVGMRQHHVLLDVGCGSLRSGRLLIPYLNAGNYVGVEPNKWLVKDGIRNEIGQDMISIKRPRFFYQSSLDDVGATINADYAVAQSIFSHCGMDLFDKWLGEISKHLKPTGALFATFLDSDQDSEEHGWIYPGCVKYRAQTIRAVAEKNGLGFKILNWNHPRQAWAIFPKSEYDESVIVDGTPAWNNLVKRAKSQRSE